MSDRKSLAIITVDCMRADHVNEGTTPSICSLGRRGLVYASAYSNGCGTPDSFPAIFASRPAYAFADNPGVDVDSEYALKPDDVTLAEALQSAGYETAAFIGGNPYLGRRYGYHRGFMTFVDNQPGALVDQLTGGRLRGALRSMAHRMPWSPYPSADRVTKQALDWLASRQLAGEARPFMLWVHYMDAHFPTLPPGHRGLKERQAAWAPIRGEGARFHDTLVRLYQESLRYVDRNIARLLKRLPSDALVVVTSDHGQLFGEHSSYHHNGVWEQLLRVPLVLAGPGIAPGVAEGIVQHLDLAPHLLGLLDVSPPPTWRGQALHTPEDYIYAVSNNPGTRSYTEALIGMDTKLVRTPARAWEYPRLAESPDMVLEQEAA